uniref:Protein TsetseEP domain-containing protein n=1 Tax=Anopheles atroparvus TaxID=41427 RepID=A0AAG5DCD9_ANOAO
MRSSCLLVVFAFLCALQSTSGRPDLGLNGEIKGSVVAKETASFASMLLNLLDDYTFVLGADYLLLNSVANALSQIAATLADKGTIMANSVALLVEDNSGIVTPPFEDAIAGIEELLTLLTTRFPSEFLTLQYREKTYITDMLNDDFDYLSETLTTLNGILGSLQSAAEEAQASAGGDELPVSIDLIRKYISPRSINSLMNAIARLPTVVSPFLYSIDSTLANVDQADTYILEVKSDIESFLLQAHQEVVLFNGQLRQLKTDTVDVIENVDALFQEQQTQIVEVLPVLQSASTFQDDLEDALLSFEQTVSPGSIAEKTVLIQDRVASYISIAKTFDDDLVTLYGDRICPVVISVVKVLVASGPYAPYCFRKYSPKVLDLAAHHYYDLTECYQLELNRIYSLHRLIVDLVDLVSFNYGELFDDFAVCLDAQPCPGVNCNACVQTLGEVLGSLSRLADEKFDLILQVVPTELDASLQRLDSCVAFANYKLVADAHDLVIDVFQCEENGYN